MSSEEHLLSSIPQHVLQELDVEHLMGLRVKSTYYQCTRYSIPKRSTINNMLVQSYCFASITERKEENILTVHFCFFNSECYSN